MFKRIFNIIALMSALSTGAVFAQAPPPCAVTPATCIPLTYESQTVYAPATFGPSPTKSIFTKPNVFEIGLTSAYLNQDFGGSHDISVGVFTAYDFTNKHVGLEASASQTPVAPNGIRESEYLTGVRVFANAGNFKFIAKGLVGDGHFNGQPGTHRKQGNYIAPGAAVGFEYGLSRHLVAGLDAQRTWWTGFHPNTLTPYQFGGRVAYRF